MLKFVVGSFGLDSVLLTEGSILDHCYEVLIEVYKLKGTGQPVTHVTGYRIPKYLCNSLTTCDVTLYYLIYTFTNKFQDLAHM
jgi:hypothetical protein